jgi:hypothetical protein
MTTLEKIIVGHHILQAITVLVVGLLIWAKARLT